MNEQQKRSRLPLVLVGGLLLIACAVFGTGKYLEHTRIQQLNEALARIPAEYGFSASSVDGSLFGRSLTLKTVTFVLPSEENTLTITVEEASGEGLNPAALLASGFTTLADRLTLRNVTVTGKEFTTTADRYILEGIQADVPKFRAAVEEFLAEEKDGGRVSEPGAKRWEESVLESFVIGLFDCANWRLSGSNGAAGAGGVDGIPSVTIGSARVANYAGLTTGPVSLKDIEITDASKKHVTLSIKEAGMAGAALPDSESARKMDVDTMFPLGRNTLTREIGVSGLFVRQCALSMTFPDGTPGAISLAEADLNVKIAGEYFLFASHTSMLQLEKKLLFRGAGALEDLRNLPETLREIEPYLPETIVYNGGFSMEAVAGENGNSIMRIKPVTAGIDGFGSLEFSTEMEFEPNSMKDPLFRQAGMTLTDHGVSDFLFNLAARDKGITGQQMRGQALMMAGASGAMLRGSAKEALRNAVSFLERPGATFSMNIQPSEALDAETLSALFMTDPDALGVTSSVTRGAPEENNQ